MYTTSHPKIPNLNRLYNFVFWGLCNVDHKRLGLYLKLWNLVVNVGYKLQNEWLEIIKILNFASPCVYSRLFQIKPKVQHNWLENRSFVFQINNVTLLRLPRITVCQQIKQCWTLVLIWNIKNFCCCLFAVGSAVSIMDDLGLSPHWSRNFSLFEKVPTRSRDLLTSYSKNMRFSLRRQ
jgi:hypothetical protein